MYRSRLLWNKENVKIESSLNFENHWNKLITSPPSHFVLHSPPESTPSSPLMTLPWLHGEVWLFSQHPVALLTLLSCENLHLSIVSPHSTPLFSWLPTGTRNMYFWLSNGKAIHWSLLPNLDPDFCGSGLGYHNQMDLDQFPSLTALNFKLQMTIHEFGLRKLLWESTESYALRT